MTVLFLMQSPEFFRFYEGAVRVLSARGHRVVIAVNKQNEAKPVRLGELHLGEGVEFRGVVPSRGDRWRNAGRRLRGVVDFLRYLHPRFAAATALRDRMKHKVLPAGFRWLDRIGSLSVDRLHRVLRTLRSMEDAIPSSPVLERFIQQEHPDVILVSPLIDAASDQVEFVKSAQAVGVPVGACIASWDNLTNKGLMRVEPDAVFVWNDAQKREAIEYHGVPAERVVTTGAQVFDRWFSQRPADARAAFCAQVGLRDDRPFLLYTCSSSFIFLSPAELRFVRQWIAAVLAVPGLRDVNILIRPHPYNGSAWETADLSEWPGVSVWPRGGYNPMDDRHREAFFDSLYHSAAVVGVNTSAMIEAAIIGRPVLSLASDAFAGTQEGTLHFHYLLPENGGFLRMAGTLDAHVSQLADALRQPDVVRDETRRFVASFIRPHGLDRDCAPLLADAIEALGRSGPRPPRVAPAAAARWRPFLMVANAYIYCATVWTNPKAARQLRKEIGSALRRSKQALRRSPDRLRRRYKQLRRVFASR